MSQLPKSFHTHYEHGVLRESSSYQELKAIIITSLRAWCIARMLFLKLWLIPYVPVAKSFHSRVEDSGYTQAYNNEPVTFRPFENHDGEVPGYITWRPTGRSIMKRDFNRNIYMLVSAAVTRTSV